MKAAVFSGVREFRIEDVEEPKLEPNGAIIKIKAVGICGSDLHIYNMGGTDNSRGVLGHEFSGEVVDVGANVTGITPGMRVAVGGSGAYAEYVGLQRAAIGMNLFPLPDHISLEEGAMTEPASVGVNAADRAEPQEDDIVVVLGAGMIGQGTWQAFKAKGAGCVVVCEMGRKRLEVTRDLGPDVVIDAAEEDVLERINEITSGEGADIVADCAGSASALQQAVEMVRGGGYWQMTRGTAMANRFRQRNRPAFSMLNDGGKIMLMSVYEQTVEWQPTPVMVKGVRMIGCIAGRMGDALELMKAGKIKTKSLVTHEFPLTEITEAFEMQARPDKAVKVLIKPYPS